MKIKNEKKALQMFCSDDEVFRKQLTTCQGTGPDIITI